jgi:hypothetical protein
MAAESVSQKLLAADGIPVPDVAFRHGKRLASMEKKVSPTKHQLQLPVMHHDMRPEMEFFIRRGDDKATDETVDFTLSLLRIAEATVDTKIGDPGYDDPDAEVDAEAQAPLQFHEDAAPADDDNENDQATEKKKKKRSQRTEKDRIECPICEKKLVKKKKQGEIRRHKCVPKK